MTRGLDREGLAILVHEVRSPVAALAAIATAFADLPPGDDAKEELVALVISASRAVERLVVDAAPASLRLEAVDVAQVASDVAAAAHLGGARVELRIDGEPPILEADPVRLRQALANLVTNAAVHAGTDIGITVACDHQEVRISVSDSGAGIPPSDLTRVFEPGIRLDRSRPGSGLGLSVTRAVVEAHGGEVRATSSDRGTTFTMVFPIS